MALLNDIDGVQPRFQRDLFMAAAVSSGRLMTWGEPSIPATPGNTVLVGGVGGLALNRPVNGAPERYWPAPKTSNGVYTGSLTAMWAGTPSVSGSWHYVVTCARDLSNYWGFVAAPTGIDFDGWNDIPTNPPYVSRMTDISCCVAILDPAGGKNNIFTDGVAGTPASPGSWFASITAANRLAIGAFWTGTWNTTYPNVTQRTAAVAVWNRALSDSDALAISKNPMVMFRQGRRSRLFVPLVAQRLSESRRYLHLLGR